MALHGPVNLGSSESGSPVYFILTIWIKKKKMKTVISEVELFSYEVVQVHLLSSHHKAASSLSLTIL